jgi:nucleoside-diphosphate-sugar epimerase
MSSRILVTGVNGYLGSRCIQRLAREGSRDVIALWHQSNDRLLANPPSNIHYEQCDLTNQASVHAVLRRWQFTKVLHASALLPDGRADYAERARAVNVLATKNLAAAAADAGCERFVYCSTINVYGTVACPTSGWTEEVAVAPANIYGRTKYDGEEAVRIACAGSRMTGFSLRLAGVHGPGRRGGVVFHAVDASLTGRTLRLDNPATAFQLLFLDDAVNALVGALDVPAVGSHQPINVASHRFASMREMVDRIASLSGSAPVIDETGVRTAEAAVMNTERMVRLLSAPPSNVESRLREIIAWVRAGE